MRAPNHHDSASNAKSQGYRMSAQRAGSGALVVASLLALAGCASATDAPSDADQPAARDESSSTTGLGAGASDGESPSLYAAPLSYSSYIPLGDSYSAANGAVNDGTACLRGAGAWPNLLRPSLTLQNTADLSVACSGATTAGVTGTERGNLPQVEALKSADSALVTITIGGNDIDVTNELLDCIPIEGSCATAENEARVNAKVDAARTALVNTYNALRTAAPKATIVAVGYPLMITGSATATCTDGTGYGFDADERNMIRRAIHRMNTVIESAATEAKISSITTQVEQHFEGNEVCSGAKEPYIHVPADELALTAWFHPTAAGNAAYAAAVLEGLQTVVTKIGTVEQPGPDTDTTMLPSLPDTGGEQLPGDEVPFPGDDEQPPGGEEQYPSGDEPDDNREYPQESDAP